MENKVSIIINCFNGEKYLREAIESVYAQTYANWEIIFWDNNSSDSSSNIVKKFDKKLKYFKAEKTTNLSQARQLAVEKCSGEWIAFLDTDDYWYEDKLEKQILKVRDTKYVVCYAGVDEINEEGVRLRSLIPKYKDGNQLKEHLNQFDINMVTPIIKRNTLVKHQIRFDSRIVASEEYNIFLKLACVGKFCSVNEVLGVWRIREDSLTNQSSEHWSKDRRLTLDSLKELKPEITTVYSKEFNKAYSTSYYYEARHLMLRKKIKKARNKMKKIRFENLTFFILWLISYSVSLWYFVHRESIKRILSSYVLGFSKAVKGRN